MAIVTAASMVVWSALDYARILGIVGARGTDFAQYYTAARLTLAHGWAAPYDVANFMTALHALTGQRDAYANLLAPAALVMPLSGLPIGAAYAIWNCVMVGVFTVASAAAAPGRGWQRVAQLLAGLAAFQVLSAIGLGQIVLALGGLLVLHWWLLRRGHPVLAGIAIGLAFVKPQNVFLVPAALFLAGHRRAALACVATAAALGGACLLALGPDGLRMYVQTVTFEKLYMPAGQFAAIAVLGGAVPAAVVVAPVLATLLAALDRRPDQPERPIVAGVLGSQLATPYLNGSDLALLVPCAWLTLRTDVPRWVRWVAVAANFVPALQNEPLRLITLTLQLLWLGALAAPPLHRLLPQVAQRARQHAHLAQIEAEATGPPRTAR
jgi:hypothetical protein